jgi:exodeoxyribonuclease-3
MKIISWNVNGLRSVYRSDFAKWAEDSGADVICLQEVKAHEADVAHLPLPQGYQLYFNCAERKGYSGVACYMKKAPERIETKLGHERFDKEGRMIELIYPHLTVVNFYIPNGARDKRDIPYKLEVYDLLYKYFSKLLKKGVPLALAGDFNIARTEMDLARPRENKNNTMFTPEERAALERLLSLGFTDTFRTLHPEATGKYTWWPYFANARPRNLGWRIDYELVSPDLATRIDKAAILDQVMGSDHCPIEVDLKV